MSTGCTGSIFAPRRDAINSSALVASRIASRFLIVGKTIFNPASASSGAIQIVSVASSFAINQGDQLADTRHELARCLLKSPVTRSGIFYGGWVGETPMDALGIVREDDELLAQADRAFAALGLDWHRGQTEALLRV